MPNQGPPHGIPSSAALHDGYQTVRGGNPLRSFTQTAGVLAPPPTTTIAEQRTAHIVRPVVVASPTLRTSSASGRPLLSGINTQKATSTGKLPIGVAQPRVNVANVYAYSSVRALPCDDVERDQEERSVHTPQSDLHKYDAEELKPLRQAPSTEDFNVNEIDHMIDTLQQLQQEFTEK
jgi:hypothetical protein